MAYISGVGSMLPECVITNKDFISHHFYDKNGTALDKVGAEVIAKLESITGIKERRYVPFTQDSVPLMTETAWKTLENAGLTPNDLDGIIVAHNAGNMIIGEKAFHTVPNMAALLKNALKMDRYDCAAYDILFGCPGWIQGLIQAHQTIEMGDAKNILVLGIEIASRLLDPHDLDSMILADGCGACVVSQNVDSQKGILSYATFSHAQDDYRSIYLGKSNNPETKGLCYFHMNGKDVYRYATTWVPRVIDKALEKANISIEDVDIFLFHQANEKMLQAFVHNLSENHKIDPSFFKNKVPATIQFTGNTSVATVPTMLDLILKNKLEPYTISKGSIGLLASVGAGMHCNALVHQF